MVEKLTLPGLRLRKTELPNQVYIASKDYLCMTEVFMPAVMRNARPEQAVEMVQQEVRAMAELEVVDQEEYDRLSPLQQSVVSLPPALYNAIADNDASAIQALAKQYGEGDFVSVNFGLISSGAMIEALRQSSFVLPSSFYQQQLRANVNDLGAGFHLELGLERDGLSGRDKGVGLYATCDPRVRGLADQRIEYAKSVFSSPRTVQRLSPLSLVQYAADGLDLAHGEYLSEHPEAVSAEEPSLDVMLFEGAELLNVEGRMVILINGGSLEDFFGRGK